MATIITDVGKNKQTVPALYEAGNVTVAYFVADFSTVGLLAADTMEIGVLPAFAKIVDWTIVPENMAGVAVDVGIMSGNVGDPDAARTNGTQFFAAQAITATTVRGAAAAGFNLAPAGVDRGIGIKPGTNIAAGAGKKVTLIVQFAMD
jgi:hypothetical protein